jgi:predicted transcriptional regulator
MAAFGTSTRPTATAAGHRVQNFRRLVSMLADLSVVRRGAQGGINRQNVSWHTP